MGRTELILAIIILIANGVIGMIAKRQKAARAKQQQGGGTGQSTSGPFGEGADEEDDADEGSPWEPPARAPEYAPPPIASPPIMVRIPSQTGRPVVITPPPPPPVGGGGRPPIIITLPRSMPGSMPGAATPAPQMTPPARRRGQGSVVSREQPGSMRRDEGSRIGTRSRSGFERRGAERAARELARKRERDRRRAERQARMIARKAAAKVRTDRGMASRAVRTKVKDPEALLSPMARNLRAKFRDLETLRLAVIAGEVFGRPRCERPHAGGIGS